MSHYIGVKMVQAEPQEQNGRPGYQVIYPDGYVSWSPKDVFEDAYLPLANANKITQAEVDAFLGQVEASQIDHKTTLVKAETMSGFVQYEVSSCVDPANYDHALGTKIATDRIKDRLWMLLGFVLQWGRYGLREV